ncbi:hypothetical protein GSU68_11285 [Rathayibacter sp. VKM Ac-2759]|uniref:hypothetical protein n=1 Tax=Rathayibacter sp. VKM Ac-2759 TaxID=2609252 RepID=UPI00131847DA|nr:hypothetical protein [Rathayibacter sp. VKM Ac-2759]QHC67088.1 hypothetical protein GSU68_11285 [Rathayibacter sp. VKM Ac-2759]
MTPLIAGITGAVVLLLFVLAIPAERALSASLTLALWSVTLFGMFLAPSYLWQGSLEFSICVLLMGIYRARHQALGHASVLILSTVWFVFIALTSVAGAETYPPARAALLFGASVLAVVAGLMLDVTSRARVLRGFVWIGVFQTCVCVWEISPVGFPIYGYRNGAVPNPLLGDIVDRAQGTLGHPNPLAMVLCLALVATISGEASMRRRVQVVIVPVLVFGIFLTGTRIALPAAVAGVVIYLLLQRRIGRFLRSVVLIAVAGSAVFAQFSEAAIEIVTELGESGSWQQRLGSVSAYPSLLSRPDPDFWVGSGFANEAALYAHGWIVSPFGVALIDNWPIYVLGTLGLLGFGLFVTLWATVVIKADRVGVALTVVLTVFFFNFDIGRLLSPTVIMFAFFAVAVRPPSRQLSERASTSGVSKKRAVSAAPLSGSPGRRHSAGHPIAGASGRRAADHQR